MITISVSKPVCQAGKKTESLAGFDRITAMPTMGFADISDNEANPFVAKIIRQGFVAHVHADSHVSFPGGHQH